MISATYGAMMLFSAVFGELLGSFWGISDREQGRPTADIGGNFGGPGEGTKVDDLPGRPLDSSRHRPQLPPTPPA
jgi:hypothetical protein